MVALVEHIVGLKKKTGLPQTVFARSVVEDNWTEWEEDKKTLKALSFDKRSDEDIVCKALVAAVDRALMEREERSFMATMAAEKKWGSKESHAKSSPRVDNSPRQGGGSDRPDGADVAPTSGPAGQVGTPPAPARRSGRASSACWRRPTKAGGAAKRRPSSA